MHDGQLASDSERTTLDLPLEVKADGAPGTFEGYGAVFGNTDRDGDVVAKGAFAESLKARLPALLWQHNAKEPIGRFDVVREDDRGLYVRGRLSMTGKGAEAYELLKMGALNGLSIGFVTKEAMRNRATGTRTINRADLMEVSLVTFPANELARVSTVKSEKAAAAIETPRDFERMLRRRGFSRARAKAITAKGFRTRSDAALGEKDIQTLLDTMDASRARLEQKRRFNNRIRLFEGRRASGVLSGRPQPPTVLLEIIPPFPTAKFTCDITYWSGKGAVREERLVRLSDRKKVDVFRLRRTEPIRSGNISDGLRRIEFIQQITFDLNYHIAGIDRGPGSIPKDEFQIVVR